MALGDGIRRNIASVSSEEREHFRDALIKLNLDPRFCFPGSRSEFPAGGVSYWFKQDEIHQATHVHGSPAFLPWHRELCNRLEAMLREADPLVSLHYWDWNTDPNTLFTADFMGNAKGEAGKPWRGAKFYIPELDGDNYRDDKVHSLNKPTTDPATWSYKLHANPADPPKSLTRNKKDGAPRVGQTTSTPSGPVYWPTDAQLVGAATFQGFNDLMQGTEMGTSNNGAHGLAHGYIGGNITDAHMAFRDPFVFLLHANVDRLWAMWQMAPGNPKRLDPEHAYGTFGSDPSITKPLQPWAGWKVWPTRPWYNPENQQVEKNCMHLSVVLPPRYDAAPVL
jgi:hypothetical protein